MIRCIGINKSVKKFDSHEMKDTMNSIHLRTKIHSMKSCYDVLIGRKSTLGINN